MPAKVRCPTCRSEVPWQGNSYRPFCSERCQLVDLGAWTTGRYRIPAEEPEVDTEDDEDASDKSRN